MAIMRYVALFEDTPAMMAVRAAREAAHMAYLREHAVSKDCSRAC